jgi:hypothetical protein
VGRLAGLKQKHELSHGCRHGTEDWGGEANQRLSLILSVYGEDLTLPSLLAERVRVR